MSRIRSVKDAEIVMDEFESIFKYDTMGQKHYLFFQEKKSGDTVTIMKYANGTFTINRKGDNWAENGETYIENPECAHLMWKNRGNISQVMERLAK